ncbi:MAG: Gmad2 immunoglobulin-like domain-containing protein [Patescibacteria group bacterium]
MIKGKYYLILLGIILVAAVLLRISSFFSNKSDDVIKQPESVESFVLEGESKTEVVATSTVSNTEPEKALEAEAVITSPQPLEIVSSPLVVSGQAKGSWFFEASLPVKLIDEAGNVIAVAPAQAESDWMTTEFVPFKALLEFTGTSSTGYLIVAKDNPSGLAEFDDSISIPLRFLTK